jgi:hypothetical protein
MRQDAETAPSVRETTIRRHRLEETASIALTLREAARQYVERPTTANMHLLDQWAGLYVRTRARSEK